MNKKIFSLIGISAMALAIMFSFGIAKADAAITFQGDLPDDGINYRVEAYTAAQGSPCDAAVDTGSMYFSTGWGPGDSNYDDNDDYSSGSFAYISTPAHIYLCRSGDPAGTSRVYFTHAITDANDYELDFGFITGTANTHNDLGSKYVHVCDALTGGNVLSSVNAATAADGSYSQYYYMWQGTVTADGGNIDNVYMFIDDDITNKCTFDATKKAGLYIDPDSETPYNYGIYITDYSPGNKVSAASNLHDDINGWIRVKSNATGNPNIGLTGLVAAETYTLYYDEPESDKVITAEAFKTAVDTDADVAMTVSNIDYDFSALSLFRKISGTTPSDVSYVQTTLSPANTGTDVIFRTTTDSSTPKVYTLYIPTAETPTVKFQDSGSTELFSYLYGAPVGADDVLYINKLAGSVHADLDASDTIQVFEVNDCTGITNIQAVAVNPSGAGGTYAAYFADLGDDVDVTEDYYVEITNGSYTTCGAIFQVPLARERTGINFDIKVDGTVPAAIDRVAVDDDAALSASTSADTCSAYGNVSGGIYTMFVTDEATLGGTTVGYVDGTSNVFFPTVLAPDTELLETAKDLTSDKTVDVGEVIGDAHADFQNVGEADDIRVYSDATASTVVSSELVQPVAGTGANDSFTQYYEATGGDTSYYFWAQAQFNPGAGVETYETIAVFAGGAGQSGVIDITNKLEGDVYGTNDGTAADIASVAVDIDNDGDWNYYTKEVNHLAADKDYKVYVADAAAAATDDSIIFYTGTDPVSWTELLDTKDLTGTYVANTFVDLSGDEVMGASKISGSADASFRAAGAGSEAIEVYDTYVMPGTATNRLNSTSVVTDGADSYYLFIVQNNDANIGANTLDLKIADQNGYVSYIDDSIFPTAAAAVIASGSNTNYDLAEKITGDTPVGTDVIYIEDDNAPGTYFAVGIPDAVSGIYAIYIDATKKGVATGTYRFEVQEPAATKVLLRDSNVGAGVALADETFDVAKFSGTNHTGLNAGTVVIHSNTTCGAAVSSEAKAPAGGSWSNQYFEGSDSTTYYIAISDGTHSTCKSSGDALSGNTQEISAISFDKKISGTVPDASDTTTDVLSVGVTGSGAGSEFAWVNTDDPGAAVNTYSLFIDESATGMDDATINFYDAINGDPGAGTVMLTRASKDYSDAADETSDVYSAYGTAHADLEDIIICDALPTTNEDCATANKIGNEELAVGGAAYEAFFEKQAGTDYYLRVKDLDATYNYYSFDKFSTGTAVLQRNNVEIDGKLSGVVTEAYDGTTRVPTVLIGLATDGSVFPTNEISRTYSYGVSGEVVAPAGGYRMYADSGVTYDGTASKSSYVTSIGADLVPAAATTKNWSMVDGIKVTVKDAGTNPITYAKVDIYTCATADPSACTWVIGTCTQPSGPCTRTGTDAVGNGASGDYYFAGIATGTYIQARVSDPSLVFDTVYSPGSSETVNSFVTSAAAAINPVVVLTNPAPLGPTLTTPANGLVTVDTTPDLAWLDLGSDEAYYEVQVSDDVDFTGLHAGGGNTATGAIVTWTVDTVLTDDTLYYWRVRACDDASNCGDWSVVKNFYVNTTWNTMAAPTLANTAGTSQVTVSWAALTGANNYKVYKKSSSPVANTDTFVGDTAGVSFVDSSADGTWFYAVEPIDITNTAGTISSPSATSVTVDTAAPTITLSTPQGGFYNTAQQLSVTTDTASTCYYSISDVSYAAMAGGAGIIMVDVANVHTATPTPAADGLINYYVRCRDDVGTNDTLSSTILYYTYDTAVPTYSLLSISSNGDGQTVGGVLYANLGDIITVKLEASEVITGAPTVSIGGENMACALNGTLVTCTLTLSNDETLTAIIAADGAADVAGNGDTAYDDAGVNAQFDFTVPDLSTGITAPAAAAVVTNSAFTVTVDAGEANLICKYKVQADGGAVPTFAQMGNYLADLGDNTYTETAIVPGDGIYDIYTSCQDYSGNLGTDDNQDFTVRTTGPAITGVEPDTEDYAIAAQVITITSDEAINCYYATDDLKTAVSGIGWTAFDTDQGTTSPDATGLTPAAQGRAFYYVKCEALEGLVEMTDNIVVTWTYDNVAPTYNYAFLSTSGYSYTRLKADDTITLAIVASEVMGVDPTITLGGVAPDAACTKTGTNYECTWTIDADFADASTPDLSVSLGQDLAGNDDTDFAAANILTVDKSLPTLSTPAPADAATAQTSPIALSIIAGGAEAGLDCRYHFSAAKATADIAFASMGYLMSDNGSGIYGSYPYLPNGTWFVNIKCWDAVGNEGEFGDAAGAGYSFTVGTDPTDIAVTISATKSWALADGDYDNGWAWVFNVTVPTLEDELQMKFANWSGTGGSIPVANNMRFYSSQAAVAVDQAHAIPITVAETYSAAMTLTGDNDTNQAGRQIQITVEAKVPVGSASGAYSTSYGIQSL